MKASKALEPAQEASQPGSAAGIRERLVLPMPGSRIWGWAGPLLVTLLGGILRFARLGTPHGIVFDETYYVPDAYSILRHGVEINHVSNVNALLAHGSTHILSTGAEYVVHPPLGKAAIAVGEWLFGLTPFGWRFASAVAGTAIILLTARIARRMTRSTLLGCVAGLLVALDGLELVLSRTAILDIFVTFWVVAAFGMLVLERDASRARLAGVADARSAGQAPGADGDPAALPGGPRTGVRWRLVLAGAFLGLACASKFNGIWYIPVLAGLAFAWDLGARKAAGFADPLAGSLRQSAWLPVSFVAAPLIAYTASWAGWFASSAGWDRNWAAQNGNHIPIWSALDSWYQYQKSMITFGLGLTTPHTYQSNPWTWLFAYKPVAFWYTAPSGCGAKSCSQEVLAIGTPAIWWVAIPALLVCLVLWISRRDWRAGAVLATVGAGWLPWFWFAWHDHRTEFYFYAVEFLPFLVIGITLCLGLVIGPARASLSRRAVGATAVGAYLLAVLANLAYLYPVLTGQVIPYTAWYARMWFSGWIR